MNQEKIGKFILSLRKEKNMTQEELGSVLGVSDKTISKWENGRGMPDISLIIPLCKELNITINELLCGERLSKESYQEKLEENIINTIDYSNKRFNRLKRIFKVSLLIIILLLVMLVLMFIIDVNRMNHNKSVIFSTWGYDYAPAIELHEEEINTAIKEYLTLIGDTESIYDNEKTFISMRVYLLEETIKDKEYNVYAWVLKEKYYLLDNEIKNSSASSIPYKFTIKYIDNKYTVTHSRTPRDGSYYEIDMENIFPSSVVKDMSSINNDGTIERLKLDIEEQVKMYFN